MKATGIVRRIDELGRVVIPKEIRKTFKIREGDPLEIFTDSNGELIFRKYMPMGDIREHAGFFAEAFFEHLGCSVLVSDMETTIACAGLPKRDYLDKEISASLYKIIEDRKTVISLDGSVSHALFSGDEGKYSQLIIIPILQDGEVFGSVIAAAKDKGSMGECEVKTTKMLAAALAKQLV